MKKIAVLIIALSLASCSPSRSVPPTQLPFMSTSVIVQNPTSISPIPSGPQTATFTATPTVIGGLPEPTQTVTPTRGISTVTPFPTSTLFPSPSPFPTATPSSPGAGFESVTYADSRIYWGICRGNKTRFTAQVADPRSVYNVVIFIRLKDYRSDDTTPWSKGASMDPHGDGRWTYILEANAIDQHTSYRRAWVMYQIALEDVYGEVIGRTHVYSNNITLEPCMCRTPPCD